MTFVAKAAALRVFKSVRDADEESAASRNGRPMERVAPAIATRGGEFNVRKLILLLFMPAEVEDMVDVHGRWSFGDRGASLRLA